MFEIRLGPDAAEELRALTPYARKRIIEAMKRELTHAALLDRKPRKRLAPAPDSGIGSHLAAWRLRVGEHRIYYDVDERRRLVLVQRIFLKGRKTTRETL